MSAADDAEERLHQDLDVEPERAVLQIVEVHLQADEHLLHRVGIAVMQGGIAGYTGPKGIESFVTRIVFHNLVDVVFPFWSWTDEGHIADGYVP